MQERPIPTDNPQGLDVLREIPTSKYMRTKSIDFRNLISKDPSVFKDRESELADAANNTLHQLQQNPGIYSTYARSDILEGLAVINHPATQLVIAESVLDKEECVVDAANRLLTKAEAIYPETITFLWQQETTRIKLLSIVEQNKTGGIQDGKIIPEMDTILLQMLAEDVDNRKYKKPATLTALLFERSKGNISESLLFRSTNFLRSEIEKAVVKLSDHNTFLSLVGDIVSANLNAAKSSDIAQMEISIPQNIISEPEEIVAILNKLEASSLTEKKYRGLLALAKVRARDGLKTRIAEEKIREERIKTIRQQEEARINQQKATLKQQEEAIRARTAEQRRYEEASLAREALNYFHKL